MAQLKHWAERSTLDFLHRLGADFVRQLEGAMEDDGDNQVKFAEKLGVSKGRVSQIVNNPGNLTLKAMIQYARAVGRKVAVVMYDDGDAANANGPINSELFLVCWSRAGKPTNFFQLRGDDAYPLLPPTERSANDAGRVLHHVINIDETASNAAPSHK